MIYTSFPLAQYKTYKRKINFAINKVLNGKNYILGKEVNKFENNFAKFCYTKYAIGVNSGTDALIIALRNFNIGKGDEVITTANTALATIAAIINCGATPVLIDIDPIFYNLDHRNIEKFINNRTKAVIAVHLYGQCCDIKHILKICKKNKLKLIEDCSQAAGAEYHGKKIGSFGDVACFSFYPTKNLGAIGDAGLILTNKKNNYERMIKIRQYGWDKNRIAKILGINSRMDEIQAAILNIKLRYLDRDNNKRVAIANFYDKKITNSKIYKPKVLDNTKHVFHLYLIKCKSRDKLLLLLNKNNIYPSIHYSNPPHLQKRYRKLCKIPQKNLQYTEDISKNSISLPIYPELNKKQINKIVEIINKF